MIKIILTSVLSTITLFGLLPNKPFSSLSVVVLTGAHIKAKDCPILSKYKRKDCPVCKGTGKYLSGDGIKEVDCGYCEE
jgi:hypothetical protein